MTESAKTQSKPTGKSGAQGRHRDFCICSYEEAVDYWADGMWETIEVIRFFFEIAHGVGIEVTGRAGLTAFQAIKAAIKQYGRLEVAYGLQFAVKNWSVVRDQLSTASKDLGETPSLYKATAPWILGRLVEFAEWDKHGLPIDLKMSGENHRAIMKKKVSLIKIDDSVRR